MLIRNGHRAVLAAIAQQPGRWALLARLPKPGSAAALASKVRNGYFAPGFEAVAWDTERLCAIRAGADGRGKPWRRAACSRTGLQTRSRSPGATRQVVGLPLGISLYGNSAAINWRRLERSQVAGICARRSVPLALPTISPSEFVADTSGRDSRQPPANVTFTCGTWVTRENHHGRQAVDVIRRFYGSNAQITRGIASGATVDPDETAILQSDCGLVGVGRGRVRSGTRPLVPVSRSR